MATSTGGTLSTTGLTTLVVSNQMAAADIAAIAALIFDDRQNVPPNPDVGTLNTPILSSVTAMPGAFTQNGLLYVPNRGVLKTFPGDIVMVDATAGWPILVSRQAINIAGTLWNP
jgi:hypothetical protein